jgi:carboxyl-terminal processing protease
LKYDYITQYDPVDTNVRIVVLSSSITVSAGEIVCAALQDYDRAVIIGQRTYGKGYVQGTRQLAHNTELYLTAARYYTPSGRCIQEIDYTHKYLDGKLGKLNDETVYYTMNHRKVAASGGVNPDVILDLQTVYPEVISMLTANNVIKDYAVIYRNTHDTYPDMATFKLSKNDFNDFYKIASEKILTLNNLAETETANLELLLKKDSLDNTCKKEIFKLRKKIIKQKIADLKKSTSQLKTLLEKEILLCYYNTEGQMKYTFYHSDEVKKAIEIFQNNYQILLNP